MAKIPILDDFLVRALRGQKAEYGHLVMKVYMRVLLLVLGKANPYMMKGLLKAAQGDKEARIKSFLEGTKVWAEDVKSLTNTNLILFNEINPPEKGHMIFLNHVNELDFPYDCYVIRKPYLANQVIKKTVIAYWWMLAMGSQVFDNSKAMSVAVSVRNLLEGLKSNSYIVYPEGHNTYTEEIQPLKKGMIKIAFDQKIPVYVALKSGIASYQQTQKGNTVGYMGLGIVNPADFTKYEEMQTHIHDLMFTKKKELDKLTEEVRTKAKP
ncbi:lysophospholipid acyltransferase family protein [Leptospira idonii]|uniref:1-acyl-sn-glycerol-3-phosphate acyltransferase n=1 Tax=Leptospira idonii TaxID=1193500 RepID=A0A4R9M2A7_9LEPT|nr:1-acyl-sn-glycerol-3-phosphate acyltransferase [Leptospira idonii]TGN19439.1 1-acyl-sn-glycerol-3-phosphate acyltransferase [Leptospira idonii]